MLRSNERDRKSNADLDSIAPVVGLSCNCRIVISHDAVIAKRRNYACAMCGRYSREGIEVEMVVMTVRHQHDIDRWQFCKCNARIVDSFRPNEAKRRRAIRPNRIEQHIEPCCLN